MSIPAADGANINTGGGLSSYFPPPDGASGGSVARRLETDSTQWTQYRKSVVVSRPGPQRFRAQVETI